jgi:hypothetical protein
MALSIQSVYLLCQPLIDSYISFSNEKFEIDDFGNKHRSAYDPKYDCITVSTLEIKYQATYHNIPVPRILLYILLHEIGHSLDPNIHTEKDVITLETTAWKIADYLMDNLKMPKTKEYFRVRDWALNNYMRKE